MCVIFVLFGCKIDQLNSKNIFAKTFAKYGFEIKIDIKFENCIPGVKEMNHDRMYGNGMQTVYFYDL